MESDDGWHGFFGSLESQVMVSILVVPIDLTGFMIIGLVDVSRAGLMR